MAKEAIYKPLKNWKISNPPQKNYSLPPILSPSILSKFVFV